MLFNSLTFLFVFLPITYLGFWALKARANRYVWLTATGYAFYAAWNWEFCGLMMLSTVVSYLAGLGLLRWRSRPARLAMLVFPLGFDLGLLGLFKYANFAFDNLTALTQRWGLDWQLPHFDVVLPLGISFYTFHTISYIVDSYRGTIKPTRNLFEFACYVSLFAQLVAGPIVRFGQIEGDLEALGTADRRAGLERGWSFFCIGLFKKVLLADTLAGLINPSLDSHQPLSTLSAWGCMLGYTYQLYFDFSGYSDMAVGLGSMFGLRLPKNFDSPYQATDPSDFWRRWHISLSTLLRDLVYVPLGGNRHGAARQSANLLATMLLGGLWHGANWTFVVWGGYHGLLLVGYQLGRRHLDRLPRLLRQAATFGLVLLGLTLFRSANLLGARELWRSMFTFRPLHTPEGWGLLAALAVAALIVHLLPNTWQLRHQWRPWATAGLAASLVLSVLALYSGRVSPFLYFQF